MTVYTLFNPHTIDEHTQSLADYMPNGELFLAKNIEQSNFRQLLKGWSYELQRLEATLIQVAQEYDPETTNDFITQWEQTVGIPDGCFTNETDIDTRRKQILFKLRAEGANTPQDFIDLAAILGYTITISWPAEVTFYPPYDVPIDLISGVPESRYIWIVTGDSLIPNVPPYDVPFSLISSKQSVLQCAFNKLKPAHTKIIFKNS